MKSLHNTTSKWVREMKLFHNWGGWQRGYFIVTYSFDVRPALIEYVIRQAEHHGEEEAAEVEDYKTELTRLLREAGIPWEEKYLD